MSFRFMSSTVLCSGSGPSEWLYGLVYSSAFCFDGIEFIWVLRVRQRAWILLIGPPGLKKHRALEITGS